MHICIIGSGVAGLMAANLFATKSYVKKITHIQSSKIPSIGVGESTTLNFETLHKKFDTNAANFIKESDATVKLGVMYSNWSEKEFLHYFKTKFLFEKYNTTSLKYSNSLSNKDEKKYIHDLVSSNLYLNSKNNKIPVNSPNFYYGKSWHFDAGKYILYLKKLLKSSSSTKNINIIDGEVIGCQFNSDDSIKNIILSFNQQIEADYYIISTGKSKEISNIFKIKYEDLSNILLTDKALFFPKPYENIEKEIHPYTIAKTMKNGWRWITPTQSRVGTGYVFSSNYISVEDAIKEFQEDIQNSQISPNVVDFEPKYNRNTFNKNYMTLGMSNGFLEPLDAPGLSISCALTMLLDNIFHDKKQYNNILNKNYEECDFYHLNQFVEKFYKGWAAFILSQYKTCHRTDTDFWKEYKTIEFDHLTNLMENLYNCEIEDKLLDINDPKIIINSIESDIIMMIQNTLSSKNIRWKSQNDKNPIKINDSECSFIDHYSFIKKINK